MTRLRDPQTLFWAMIVTLLLCYGGFKAHHITLAFQAYQGQALQGDTHGAAK